MPAIPSFDQTPNSDQHKSDSDPKISKEKDQDSSTSFPTPLQLLEIRDLSSTGSKRFLQSIDPSTILSTAIKTVHEILVPNQQDTPNVRSISLILRDFSGVAYTTGKDIDFEHKEIHFSTSYIENIKPELLSKEITGVIVHEMVHVWQWNGKGECNGGLIEGVADWVRLKAGLGPPHWKKRAKDCEWDDGYDVTGYFLESLEEKFGKDIVVKMNQKLRQKYVEEEFWPNMCAGADVHELWDKYAATLNEVKEADHQEDKSDLPERTVELESQKSEKPSSNSVTTDS